MHSRDLNYSLNIIPAPANNWRGVRLPPERKVQPPIKDGPSLAHVDQFEISTGPGIGADGLCIVLGIP